MNDALLPYPEYKDSNLHWVGRIPKHWNEKRAKYFFSEVDERSTTGEEQLMSVSHKTGVTPRKSNVTMFKAASNVGHKICRSGDLAINTLWAWMAALGVSRETGLVSPAYGVYRQKDEANFHPEYIDFLLRTQPYATEYRCRSTGITTSRLRLYPIDFLRIPLVQPPRDEQELIVNYLRQQDTLVRKFIRNRRRLIEVLSEQKQAIINQAVTRGLDPTAPLKPSGGKWLGDIPEHWTAAALRRRWLVIDCKHLTVPFVDEGVPLVSVREVQHSEINLSQCKRTTRMWHEMLIEGDRDPRQGDLIYCRNVSVGACAYVASDEPLAMGQDVCLIRSTTENQRFLNYFIRSGAMKQQLAALLVGSTFNRINVSDVKSLIIAVPPRVEQDEIVDLVDDSLQDLNRPIAVAQSEIVLIREYRTRLIADVVTGKLDVRHLAPPPDSLEADEVTAIDPDDLDDEFSDDDEAELVEEAADAD